MPDDSKVRRWKIILISGYRYLLPPRFFKIPGSNIGWAKIAIRRITPAILIGAMDLHLGPS